MAKRAVRERVEKNGQYWQSRFKAMENDQYRKSAGYYKDLQEQFRRAQNDIQMDIEHWYQRLADNNEISLAGAKRLLRAGELDEFKWNVEQYIKAGEENALDQRWMKQLENASARSHISRLEAMKLQIQQHAEVLFTEYEGGVTEFLNKRYAEQFYHTAFEIARGTGVGSNLAAIDTRRMDALIRRPWAQDGANFSDRIWSSKEKLVNTLHTELTQHIIRGADTRQAIDNLARTMEVSRAQAGRLIMTESAAISSAATQECFKELGVDQYKILAALDSRTCDICQDLDGEVFAMKEYEVGMTAPPFHPFCRCTTVPYLDDEFSAGEQRAAGDLGTGKTVYVPADMKYKEWKQKYVPQSMESTEKTEVRRSREQLTERGKFLKQEIRKYTNHESKWSGTVEVNNKRCEELSCSAQKEWNCNILLRDDVFDGVILHELLHSCSASYFQPADYIVYGAIEEGSVELLTQELARELGIQHVSTYPQIVGILRNINEGLGLYDTDLKFAMELFDQPMTDRFTWLQNRVNECIIHNNKVSLNDAEKIMDYLDKLGGGIIE